MEYKQIESKGLKIVGRGVNTSIQNAPTDCEPLWLEFMNDIGKVKNIANQSSTYGVSFVLNQQECSFRYVAGVEVSNFEEGEVNFESVEVPASTYLVFTHRGRIDTLGNTYYEIMQELQALGRVQKSFWIEHYDNRYIPNSDDSEFDIWIAVN